jgi:hypothetical protein
VAEARKRTRRSAKSAGARFEREIADWLATHVDDHIDRRVKTGAKDCGDLAGIRAHGQKVVAELKNTAAWNPGTWLREAEKERANDGALAGFVIAKRHGIADPAQQVVLMTLADFAALLTGTKPTEQEGS